MNLLYAIILFCSTNVAQQDCDFVNAKRYERVPGGQALPVSCMKNAEFWAAEHNLIPTKEEYLIVRCSNHEFGARVG